MVLTDKYGRKDVADNYRSDVRSSCSSFGNHSYKDTHVDPEADGEQAAVNIEDDIPKVP